MLFFLGDSWLSKLSHIVLCIILPQLIYFFHTFWESACNTASTNNFGTVQDFIPHNSCGRICLMKTVCVRIMIELFSLFTLYNYFIVPGIVLFQAVGKWFSDHFITSCAQFYSLLAPQLKCWFSFPSSVLWIWSHFPESKLVNLTICWWCCRWRIQYKTK